MPYGAIDREEAAPLVSLRSDEADAPRTQRKSVGAALVIVGTLALAAVSASPATAKHTVGRTMFAAGRVISGNDELRSQTDSEECGDCEALCAKEQLFSEKLFAETAPNHAEIADMAAQASPTASPTSHYDDWTIYFTDGAEGESYVWYMESWKSGIFASVLVDTTGFASGVAVAKNDTSIFFTDFTGSVWKVERNGYDLKELVTYDGQPMGLELTFDYTDASGTDFIEDAAGVSTGTPLTANMLYWADSTGYVYQSTVDGRYFRALISPGDIADFAKTKTRHTNAVFEPVDVKMHVFRDTLYVACATSGTVYRYAMDDKLLYEYVYLSNAIPHGLWVDNDNQDLYFTSLSTSTNSDEHDGFVAKYDLMDTTAASQDYYDTEVNIPFKKIITNITAYGVAVDSKKNIIFVTTDTELMLCDTDGGYVETVARLENLFFVYALYLPAPTVPPTPMPSPLPTTIPVPQPTGIPTPVPIASPTSLPMPVPTSIPIGAPTSLPTMIPTPAPIPSPTSIPVPAPTGTPIAAPTSYPVPSPTAYPIPSPTSYPIPSPSAAPIPSPTSVPTSLPMPTPTSLPIPSPTAVPTSLPEPAPTSIPTPTPTTYPIPSPTSYPVPSPTSLPTPVPTSAPTEICEYYLDSCGLCACATEEKTLEEATLKVGHGRDNKHEQMLHKESQ